MNTAGSVRTTLASRFRRYFLTGLVVAAPISITVYLTWRFIATVDAAVAGLVPPSWNPHVSIPGLGVLTAVVFLTLVGFLTANFVGRYIIGLGEKLLDRMPVIRSIYGTLKQVFETVASPNAGSFKEVVLVEYPRAGLWTLAFVTNEPKGEIAGHIGEDVLTIFIPFPPAPTAGFMGYVRRREAIYLNMSVEEGLKQVISAGMIPPPDRKPLPLRPTVG